MLLQPGPLGQVARAGVEVCEAPDDRLVFDTTARNLCYDADGSGQGVAIEIASLINTPAISASDFLVAA